MPKITEPRKKRPELLAETLTLRQEVRRLTVENQKLKAQLSKGHTATNSLDDDAKHVLAVIKEARQILVRDIARRLRFHPRKVDHLLEDLEFVGYVHSRLSLKGTYYSLTQNGRKYLASK